MNGDHEEFSPVAFALSFAIAGHDRYSPPVVVSAAATAGQRAAGVVVESVFTLRLRKPTAPVPPATAAAPVTATVLADAARDSWALLTVTARYNTVTGACAVTLCDTALPIAAALPAPSAAAPVVLGNDTKYCMWVRQRNLCRRAPTVAIAAPAGSAAAPRHALVVHPTDASEGWVCAAPGTVVEFAWEAPVTAAPATAAAPGWDCARCAARAAAAPGTAHVTGSCGFTHQLELCFTAPQQHALRPSADPVAVAAAASPGAAAVPPALLVDSRLYCPVVSPLQYNQTLTLTVPTAAAAAGAAATEPATVVVSSCFDHTRGRPALTVSGTDSARAATAAPVANNAAALFLPPSVFSLSVSVPRVSVLLSVEARARRSQRVTALARALVPAAAATTARLSSDSASASSNASASASAGANATGASLSAETVRNRLLFSLASRVYLPPAPTVTVSLVGVALSAAFYTLGRPRTRLLANAVAASTASQSAWNASAAESPASALTRALAAFAPPVFAPAAAAAA